VRGTAIKFAVALGVGLLLLGAAAIVGLATSDAGRFYQVAAWVGLGVFVVAVVQAGLLAPWVRSSGSETTRHSDSRDIPGADADGEIRERRGARLRSVYTVVAAVPCLITAGIHYL